MKRTLLIAASIGAVFALAAGCKSLPTAQEQFNTFCPIVNADLQTVATSPLLNADQQATAQKAHDLNVKICSAGASLNVADAKDLANTLLPAVVTIVSAVPAFPQQTAVVLALQTFGPIALQMVEQIVASAQGASAAVAASVPAASQ